MNSLIIIITAFVLFALQMCVTYKRRLRTIGLLPVEAGPTKTSRKNFMIPEQVRVGTIEMDTQLDYFVVENHCMELRGIYPGDVIGVQKFNNEFTLNDTDENSVMLIFLNRSPTEPIPLIILRMTVLSTFQPIVIKLLTFVGLL